VESGCRLIWTLGTTASFDYGTSSEGSIHHGSRIGVLTLI